MKTNAKSDVSDALRFWAADFEPASETVGNVMPLKNNRKSTAFPTFPTVFPTPGMSVGNVGNPFRVSDVPTPRDFRQQKG